MHVSGRIAVAFVACIVSRGQPSLQFEAASVRRVDQDAARLTGGRYGPEGVLIKGATVRALILDAYGVKAFQVVGPHEIDKDLFALTAKVPVGSSSFQVNVMLQNLLRERFSLTLHHESREYAVYHLQLADGGSKIHKYVSARRGAGEIALNLRDGVVYFQVRSATMEGLAQTLGKQIVLPVMDKTGLTESYSFAIEFANERGVTVANDVPAPSIFTVLREQLGLSLVKTKDVIDTLVVDSVAKTPTAN